jgi:hypothetical protein
LAVDCLAQQRGGCRHSGLGSSLCTLDALDLSERLAPSALLKKVAIANNFDPFVAQPLCDLQRKGRRHQCGRDAEGVTGAGDYLETSFRP